MKQRLIQISAALGAGALALRLCGAWACGRWPGVACHYWADFLRYGRQASYWRATGETTAFFLVIGLLAALTAWLLLTPRDEAEERRSIAGEILDGAFSDARTKVEVGEKAELGFRLRFAERLRRLFWMSPRR